MPAPFEFDFRNPDYIKVWNWRLKVISEIRSSPDVLLAFKDYYRHNPWDFISHWGSTFDPRNAEIGLPTTLPFILFERQEAWMRWVVERWQKRENGISEKSRDCGLSWCALSLACTLCLFNDGITIGFGSRKEEYVDKIGDPKSLFWKARMFMDKLPIDFRGSWNLKSNAPHMRILFPDSGSAITGESGDGIGRGDRQAIYFVDEAAHIERPELVEASLSATTNCRIDISSVKGMANPFAQKRHSGRFPVFTFSWRDDPRKGQEWYDKKTKELDPVSLAQEVDMNYIASVEGVVIPSAWIQAAVNAAQRLGIEPTGQIIGALDVADEGIDLNAMAIRKGVELIALTSWSGKNSDTLHTAHKAFHYADEYNCRMFSYDADGLGAFVRGDSRMIMEQRKSTDRPLITVTSFRGSGAVLMPKAEMVKGRKNEDYFSNRKAQSWWSLRQRFQNTYRAINKEEYNREQIISIPSSLELCQKLLIELSQPTYEISINGKIVINKAPDNTKSPNLADAVMMGFAPIKVGLFT